MKRKNKLKKEMGYFYSMSPGDPELNAEIFNHNTDTGDIPTGTPSGPALAEDLIGEAKKNEYEVTYIDRDTDNVTKGFVQAYSTKQAGLVFRKTHKDVYRILSIDCVEDHSKDDGEQLSLFEDGEVNTKVIFKVVKPTYYLLFIDVDKAIKAYRKKDNYKNLHVLEHTDSNEFIDVENKLDFINHKITSTATVDDMIAYTNKQSNIYMVYKYNSLILSSNPSDRSLFKKYIYDLDIENLSDVDKHFTDELSEKYKIKNIKESGNENFYYYLGRSINGNKFVESMNDMRFKNIINEAFWESSYGFVSKEAYDKFKEVSNLLNNELSEYDSLIDNMENNAVTDEEKEALESNTTYKTLISKYNDSYEIIDALSRMFEEDLIQIEDNSHDNNILIDSTIYSVSDLYDLLNDLKRTRSNLDKVNEKMKFKIRKNINESLSNKDKQIYIRELNKAEDREELEDIIHEIFFYDKSLFAKLRKLPKGEPLEVSKERLVKIINDSMEESLNEASEQDNFKLYIFLNTATRERRPLQSEDLEDFIEEECSTEEEFFEAIEDLDVVDLEDIRTEEELTDWLEGQDYSFGDPIIYKVIFKGANIYDDSDYFESIKASLESGEYDEESSWDESLDEDTIKQNGKWVNKGKEGTHGKFSTKKEADAQRKAMFANGYKEGLKEGVAGLYSDTEYKNKIEHDANYMLDQLSKLDLLKEGDEHTLDSSTIKIDIKWPKDQSPTSKLYVYTNDHLNSGGTICVRNMADYRYPQRLIDDLIKNIEKIKISPFLLSESKFKEELEEDLKVGDKFKSNYGDVVDIISIDKRKDGYTYVNYILHTTDASGRRLDKKHHAEEYNMFLDGLKKAKYKKIEDGFEKDLNEASYGGAWDVEDDMFFTREEINEFAYDIADSLASDFGKKYDVAGVYMETPTDLYISIIDEDGYESYNTFHIDMRKIRSPKDLNKYSEVVIDWFAKDFNKEYEWERRAYGESFNESKEILYVIKDKQGNQLSRPTPDDDELWDRVESMEARGKRGLKVVVYTDESLNEDIDNKKICIDNLNTNQIEKLPDKFLCVSRRPGLSFYSPVFDIVSKEDLIKNPKKCFFIDSYWGYADPRNVYIATPSQLKEYENEQIQSIKDSISKYKPYLIYYDISLSNESLNEDIGSNTTKVKNFLKKKGIDVTHPEVEDAVYYISQYIEDMKNAGNEYSIEEWWKDTLMNYPEEIQRLEDPDMYAKVEKAPDLSMYDYDYDDIVTAIEYCDENNLDYENMTAEEFEEVVIKANGFVESLNEEEDLYDDEFYKGDDGNFYKELKSKSVYDSDGFITDYTLYMKVVPNGSKADVEFVTVFGDNELYRPEDGYYDFETNNAEEAFEWFDNYDTEDWMDESLKEARYSDVYDDSRKKQGWWYFTTHGVQPGSIPKDLNVIEIKDGKNSKGTQGTFVKLDGILNTSELKKFDMKEEIPIEESLNEKLIEAPTYIQQEVETAFGDYGFEIDRKGKTYMGSIHYQIINRDHPFTDVDDMIEFVKPLADWLDEYGRLNDAPITYNFGPDKDNNITAGVDISKQYVEESLTEDLKKYDPKEWSDEDVELHKSINWAERDYEDYDTGESITKTIYLYGVPGYGDITKEVEMHKFLRANPIYSPYYKSVEDRPFDDMDETEGISYVGPMYDGNKEGIYDIHDRYETQKLYDLMFDSLDYSNCNTLSEMVNKFETSHIDEGYYDIRNMYEAVNKTMTPQEKQELKNIITATNDPKTVSDFLKSKYGEEEKVNEEIDDEF